MTDAEWLELADERYAGRSNNDIEIAEETLPINFRVSEADDGAWVLAWVWVPRPDTEASEEED